MVIFKENLKAIILLLFVCLYAKSIIYAQTPNTHTTVSILNHQTNDIYMVDHVLHDFENPQELNQLSAEFTSLDIHSFDPKTNSMMSCPVSANQVIVIKLPFSYIYLDQPFVPSITLDLSADTPAQGYIYAGFAKQGGGITVQLTLNHLALTSTAQGVDIPIINTAGPLTPFLKEIEDIYFFISLTKSATIYIDNIVLKTSSRFPIMRSVTAKTPGIVPIETDTTRPFIQAILIDGKILNRGDVVDNMPKIAVQIDEQESGLDQWDVILLDCDLWTSMDSFSGNGNGKVGAEILVTPNLSLPIPNGDYCIAVSAKDREGNESFPFMSPTFNVTTIEEIRNPLNGPNPFNPNKESTFIQYKLPSDMHARIYIYSISGELQWEKSLAPGHNGGAQGMNSVEWDGKNRFGEMVANGPYLCYLIAENGSKKYSAKIKLLVLK